MTVKWSQDDQSVRQAYNLELMDDIDDTESDHEQDDDGHLPHYLNRKMRISLSHTPPSRHTLSLFYSVSFLSLSSSLPLSSLSLLPLSLSLSPYTHHPTGDDQLPGAQGGWKGVWEGGREGGAAMQFYRLAMVLPGPQFATLALKLWLLRC